MSELDASLLARRTGLLLRCYPKAYRAHRGEEIFGTLLETTRPGRGWPPAREVASVVGGGLRARRAANLNQGLRASLRHLGILTAAMMMAGAPASLLTAIGQQIFNASHPYYPLRSMELGLALGSLVVVTALAAAWCGCRWLVAVAAAAAAAVLAAVVCHLVAGGWAITMVEGMGVPAGVALVALLPLTKRAERPPASLLWLPCLSAAAGLVEGLAVASGLFKYDALPLPLFRLESLFYPYFSYLSLVPVLVAVCWLVTDVRPLAAVALQALLTRVLFITSESYRGEGRIQMAVVVELLLVALTGALVWLLRHRARTAPPTIG